MDLAREAEQWHPRPADIVEVSVVSVLEARGPD